MNNEYRTWDGHSMDYEPRFDCYCGDGLTNLGVNINESFSLANDIFMLFTGEKDKNGKKIFDGDIVKSVLSETTDQWVIDMRNLNWHTSPIGHAFDNSWIAFEVVGNIYENPELLK